MCDQHEWENANIEINTEVLLKMAEQRLSLWLEEAEKERELCRLLYPDWEDNEFNCGHNLFIWGISWDPTDTVSFYTNNKISICYNRKEKIYYCFCDFLENKTLPLSIEEKQHLIDIRNQMLEDNKVDFPLSLPAEEVAGSVMYAETLENLIQKLAFFFTLVCS